MMEHAIDDSSVQLNEVTREQRNTGGALEPKSTDEDSDHAIDDSSDQLNDEDSDISLCTDSSDVGGLCGDTAIGTRISKDTNSSSKVKNRKRVSFGDVSCRLYNRTVGLHPDVNSGPSLDLDWEFTTVEDVTVEEYEESSKTRRRPRRSALIMSKYERLKILKKDWNVSRNDIATHIRIIKQTRAQRLRTVNNQKYERTEELIEKMTRAVKRVLFLRKPYHEEVKELWENAAKSQQRSSFSTTNSLESKFSLLSRRKDKANREKINGGTVTKKIRPSLKFIFTNQKDNSESELEDSLSASYKKRYNFDIEPVTLDDHEGSQHDPGETSLTKELVNITLTSQ